MNKANSDNKIMLIVGMLFSAAVAWLIYMCLSFFFDLGILAKRTFSIPRYTGARIHIVPSLAMVYLLSVITIYPVWSVLKMFNKLTLANLCFACAVLGICCPMAGYFILGSKNPLIFMLHRPEVIMSYLLYAVVFALALWWYVYGSKREVSANVKDADRSMDC